MSSVVVFDINILAKITLMGKIQKKNIIKVKNYKNSLLTSIECAMTFRMIMQLWNTNTPAIVSRDADLTENYMFISMKFGTGVHVFCWEVGIFNSSCFRSVSCKSRVGTLYLLYKYVLYFTTVITISLPFVWLHLHVTRANSENCGLLCGNKFDQRVEGEGQGHGMVLFEIERSQGSSMQKMNALYL